MMASSHQFKTTAERVRNWGRWGPADARGTLNLITDEDRVAAAKLVLTGQVIDLGLPLDSAGPQRGGLRNNPVRLMSVTNGSPNGTEPFRFADDYVVMPLQSGTQWDALGHVWYDDTLYNGYPSSLVTSEGIGHGSIDQLAPAIVGRGVILDVARFRGVDTLNESDVISGDELEAVAISQNVALGSGDIILVRTGWHSVFTSGDRDRFMAQEPGLDISAVEWLWKNDFGALACDNWGIGARPGNDEMEFYQVHMLLLRDMGMPLGELFDLDALAAACAQDSRYEFLFCGEILKFTRGVGTPTNPIAIR